MASETGDGFTGQFHRGPKQFVAARLSVPKSTQKPQSRGVVTFQTGTDMPLAAPSKANSRRSKVSVRPATCSEGQPWPRYWPPGEPFLSPLEMSLCAEQT